jgi:hypothetical protein
MARNFHLKALWLDVLYPFFGFNIHQAAEFFADYLALFFSQKQGSQLGAPKQLLGQFQAFQL